MCGIGAISSIKPSNTLLMREFLDMCYLSFVARRGSHSSGIAWIADDEIKSAKSLGAPGEKIYTTAADSPTTQTVIGHVRYASQGAINLKNAHPLYNEDKSMAIIHNGHLHNSHELRTKLAPTHKLETETDSELILHLFEDKLSAVHTPLSYAQALRDATDECSGQRNVIILLKDGTIVAHADAALCIEKSDNGIRLASVPTTRSNRWSKLDAGTVVVIKNGELLSKLDPAPPKYIPYVYEDDEIVIPTQTKIFPGLSWSGKKKIDWGFYK